jgi:hypothetical protein
VTGRGTSVRLAALGLVALAAAFAAAESLAACGTDVSLGGGGDADTPGLDAGDDSAPVTPSDTFDCEPCSAKASCRSTSTCAAIDASDGFCFPQCDASAQCEPDEICGIATDVAQVPVLVCLPKTGACPAVVGPTGPDGGTLDRCGTLVGPDIPEAGCKDCHYACQKNGCYGGYYCNTKTKDCVRPPGNCL